MATSKGSTKKGGAGKGGSKKGAAKAGAISGAVPPYGPPIREAIARGDAAEMRRVATSARQWIKDAQAALDKLEAKLGKSGSK